ncbi:hypothetical protein ACFLX2_01135 [Candidatus Dependentiae bacterium]
MKKVASIACLLVFSMSLKAEWRNIYKGKELDKIAVVAPGKGWAIKSTRDRGQRENFLSGKRENFLLELDDGEFVQRSSLGKEGLKALEATRDGAFVLSSMEHDARTKAFLKEVEKKTVAAFKAKLAEVAPDVVPVLERTIEEKGLKRGMFDFAFAKEVQAIKRGKMEQCFKAAEVVERREKAGIKPSYTQPLKLFASGEWRELKDVGESGGWLAFAVQSNRKIWGLNRRMTVPAPRPQEVSVGEQGAVKAVGMPGPKIEMLVEDLSGDTLGGAISGANGIFVGKTGMPYVGSMKPKVIREPGKNPTVKIETVFYKWDGSTWQKMRILLDEDTHIGHIAPSAGGKLLCWLKNQKTEERSIALWDGNSVQKVAEVDQQIVAKPEGAMFVMFKVSMSADPAVIWLQKNVFSFDRNTGKPGSYTEIYEWTPDQPVMPARAKAKAMAFLKKRK